MSVLPGDLEPDEALYCSECPHLFTCNGVCILPDAGVDVGVDEDDMSLHISFKA